MRQTPEGDVDSADLLNATIGASRSQFADIQELRGGAYAGRTPAAPSPQNVSMQIVRAATKPEPRPQPDAVEW